jgi:hypothetical protein
VLFTKYKSDQIKEFEMGGACSAHGETRNANEILLGKLEWERLLGRSRYRWDDNIRMDHRKSGLWEWIALI